MTKREITLAVVDLWKSSAIIQGSIALVSIGVIAYLYITKASVPDTLVSIVFTILGYYFGTKSQQNANKEVESDVTEH